MILMTNENTLKLSKDKNLTPRISTFYAQMQLVRRELIKTVEKLEINYLDFSLNELAFETIGTLLLHIAAVEWSWIFEDIVGLTMDFDKWKLAFPLNSDVNLPQIKNKNIKFYLGKLEEVRLEVYKQLQKMNDNNLDKIISSGEDQMTIEWILYHILEHEIIHLGQIKLLFRLKKLQNKK